MKIQIVHDQLSDSSIVFDILIKDKNDNPIIKFNAIDYSAAEKVKDCLIENTINFTVL